MICNKQGAFGTLFFGDWGIIIMVINRKAAKKCAFSNMMSVIKYHLMIYIDLFKFLENPEANWEILNYINQTKLDLFDT